MPRTDLLSLSIDDLIALSNRGNVKRAQREVEGECTAELIETAEGDVRVKWSDGVECHLPAGKSLADGRCSCAAFGLCRHLIRTVLAYQKQRAEASGGRQSPEEAPATDPRGTDVPRSPEPRGTDVPRSPLPWDPGTITDEELAQHYRPAALTRLRGQFAQGELVELVRGSKPSARFHLRACLVRFLVPGDLRYTHCDCAEPAPCSHVPLAVWAFRLLEPDREAGILATGAKAEAVPAALLDEVETLLLELAEQGLAGTVPAWTDRLRRLEQVCRDSDLIWPAEVLADLLEEQQRYAGHDARFAPERLAGLVGELLIRCDAIRADSGALPQLLIRGSRSDRAVEVGKSKYEGLGCGVHLDRRGAELTAYLQESDTGNLVVVRRDFRDPPAESGQAPRPFHELARTAAVKGYSFAALGTGTLQLTAGKRTPRGELQPGRLAHVTVQPHQFPWENLKAPVLVEDWAELDARLGVLPPSALRPRRAAEDFHVARVAGAEAAQFVSSEQVIQAVLPDDRGRAATLHFPFTVRGQAGAELLLSLLRKQAGDLRFVSGPVRRTAGGLVIEPVALVFQEGTRRFAVQPWIDRGADGPPADPHKPDAPARATPDSLAGASGLCGTGSRPACTTIDPLAEWWLQTQVALGEVFVLGLRRSDSSIARRWRDLHRQGEAVGLVRVARWLAPLAEALEQKSHTLNWDGQPAGRAVLRLAVLARFSQDVTC